MQAPAAAQVAAAEALPLPALLLLCSQAVTDAVHAQLAATGYPDITPTHGYTFQLLARTGGSTGVQLAHHLGITKQSAGAILDQLEQRGYVTRRASPDDGRARIAQLTDTGWVCIRHATTIWDQVDADTAELLGHETLATVRKTLATLAATYGDLAGPLSIKPARGTPSAGT